jgi:hypothetical protein
MKRILALFLVLLGCAATPKIRYSQLDFARSPNINFDEEMTTGDDRLAELLETVRGAQFGDAIFNRSTSVYWILPAVDRLELAAAGRGAGFTAEEFQKRLDELEQQHQSYFIFALDLRMPFHSGWSKERLIDFLQTNLIVTLEEGAQSIYHPQRLIFNIPEPPQKSARLPADEMEVQIPLRVLFSRTNAITDAAKAITVKLRLGQTPPFRIGFFDDKFFQGFRWKIVLN